MVLLLGVAIAIDRAASRYPSRRKPSSHCRRFRHAASPILRASFPLLRTSACFCSVSIIPRTVKSRALLLTYVLSVLVISFAYGCYVISSACDRWKCTHATRLPTASSSSGPSASISLHPSFHHMELLLLGSLLASQQDARVLWVLEGLPAICLVIRRAADID